LIDNSHKVQAQILETDSFIAREVEFKAAYRIAKGEIREAYDQLPEQYKEGEITDDNLKEKLRATYKKEGDMNSDAIEGKLAQLQKSLDDFNSSQGALQQIDQRKVEVSEEIESHIEHINEHRIKAGMEPYRPEKEKLEVRRLRTIDEKLRPK